MNLIKVGDIMSSLNANTADNLQYPHRRLLGQILVDGRFISKAALKNALERQHATNEQLGRILVDMGALDETQLKAALSIQNNLTSLPDAMKVAAGVHHVLGEMLTETKRITSRQLDTALAEQKRAGEKIGGTMVRLGLISASELDAMLAFQHQQASTNFEPAPLRLGELLVSTGQITRQQLEEALKKQKLSKKKIGQILIESGHIKPSQVSKGLKLQHMLVTAALTAILSFASIPGGNTAHAGSASSKFMVTASVVARTTMKTIRQVQEVVITHADIKKGYVDIKNGSKIEVRSNNISGYMLNFEGEMGPFKAIHVGCLGSQLQISSGNGFIHRPHHKGPMTIDLNYRMFISENVKPGTYRWPLMISAQSL